MHFHPPETALLFESYLRWLWVKTTEGPTLQETDFLHLPIEMHNPMVIAVEQKPLAIIQQ